MGGLWRVGMTPSKTKLGTFLRFHRLRLQLLQSIVARRAGMLQSQYSAYEIGTYRYLRPRFAHKIARVLRLDQKQRARLRKLIPVPPRAKPKTDLGRFIRARREELGITDRHLDKKLDVTPGTTWVLETGPGESVCRKRRLALEKVLRLPAATMIAFEVVCGRSSKPASPLGALIRSERIKLGLTQEQLGERLGISKAGVSAIELDRNPFARSHGRRLEKMAEALGLDAAILKPLRRPKRILAQPGSLGEYVAKMRAETGLTQDQLGLAPGTVSRIERGKFQPRNIATLEKLTAAFGRAIPDELLPTSQYRTRKMSAARIAPMERPDPREAELAGSHVISS